MGLESLDTAQQMRDIIRGIAKDIIVNEVPLPRFGRVISIDFVSGSATVWFPGDEAPVRVKFFSSTIPGDWAERYQFGLGQNTSYAGFGSIVTVETYNNTQYITGVLSGGQFSVDWRAGGYLSQMYNGDGNPLDAGSADYLYRLLWASTDTMTLPTNGGPYAINIGPFYGANSEFPENGNYEIEVIYGSGKSQIYEFSMNPYYQMARNNSGSVLDRWFRVIPTKVNEDNSSANTDRLINSTTRFSVADGVGDWVPSTNATAVADNTYTHNGGSGALKIQSTLLTATVGANTNTSGKYAVIPGATYTCSFWVMSPDGNYTGGIRALVNWYTSGGAFISTTTLSNINTTDDVWASYAQVATAPATATQAVYIVQIAGSPAITKTFYFDEIKMSTQNSVTKTDFNVDVALRETVHGSLDNDAANSYGEVWVRVYLHWLDAIDSAEFKIRVKNTGSWIKAKSTKTGKPVYEYVTAPTDAVGYLGYHDAGTPYTTNAAQSETRPIREISTGPWRNPELNIGTRAQNVMSFSGQPYWDGTNLGWTGNIIVGGIGRARNYMMSDGVTLACPTSGTVPVFPAGTTVTAVAAGIPLTSGQSLWFGVPPGITSATIPNASYFNGGLHGAGGLFILDSSSPESWVPPEWAVMVAYRIPGTPTRGQIRLGDGSVTGGNAPKYLMQDLFAAASGNLAMVAADTDIPGATVTFTTTSPNAKYIAYGYFDFVTVAAANAAIAIGHLLVDGSQQAGEALWRPAAAFNGARAGIFRRWSGTLAAVGSHTIKLRALRSGGADLQLQALQTHSSVSVEIYE